MDPNLTNNPDFAHKISTTIIHGYTRLPWFTVLRSLYNLCIDYIRPMDMKLVSALYICNGGHCLYAGFAHLKVLFVNDSDAGQFAS